MTVMLAQVGTPLHDKTNSAGIGVATAAPFNKGYSVWKIPGDVSYEPAGPPEIPADPTEKSRKRSVKDNLHRAYVEDRDRERDRDRKKRHPKRSSKASSETSHLQPVAQLYNIKEETEDIEQAKKAYTRRSNSSVEKWLNTTEELVPGSSLVAQPPESLRSGVSGTTTINNPKLLATVEDAIKRLILPELEQIKREEKIKKNSKSTNTVESSQEGAAAGLAGTAALKSHERESKSKERRKHRRASRPSRSRTSSLQDSAPADPTPRPDSDQHGDRNHVDSEGPHVSLRAMMGPFGCIQGH